MYWGRYSMKKTVLVTGATGLVGPYLIRQLGNYHCKCLVRKESNLGKLKGYNNIEFIYGDITKPKTLEAITKGVDIVFHLATMVGHYGINEFSRYYEVNVLGIKNLAEEALRNPVERFIYTTGTAVVGVIEKEVITEEDRKNPKSLYAVTKFVGEELLLHYEQSHGLPVVILRFPHILVPGEQRYFLKICKLVKWGIFPQLGEKDNLAPYIYIDDAVSASTLAMTQGRVGETYIIAPETSFSYAEVRNLVLKELGIKRRPYFKVSLKLLQTVATLVEAFSTILNRKAFITRDNIDSVFASRTFNIEKAKKELGYKPAVSLEEAIKECVKSYKDNNLI
jgi:nucleoside-diphosphate-sugar epimerase